MKVYIVETIGVFNESIKGYVESDVKVFTSKTKAMKAMEEKFLEIKDTIHKNEDEDNWKFSLTENDYSFEDCDGTYEFLGYLTETDLM